MIRVCGEADLAKFRKRWTGKKLLDLLRDHQGRMRVDWAVGVGKSHALDNLIEAAVDSNAYDLVVVLLPTRQVIDERRWICSSPIDIEIINLRPRPVDRCRKKQNAIWNNYESAELGALGREDICANCPRRRGCFWPNQYGKNLEGAQVIYATQAHLERSPSFLSKLRQWTCASTMLVLLDEVNCIMSSYRRRILYEELKTFVEALNAVTAKKAARSHQRWKYLARLLLSATTDDLRSPEWKMPYVDADWSFAVQAEGRRRFGDRFRFLGYELSNFGYSPIESRERLRNRDIVFASAPYIGCDFVIFSGTANPEFSKYRLGTSFSSPFSGYRFEHPRTTWYNIASNLGARIYFQRNSKQILDFFAALIAQRLAEGRRPLLIAKKCFANQCAEGIESRLRSINFDRVRVVTENLGTKDLEDHNIIPLITFGIVGTNLFEAFDCAYCLTGYYVTERVVNAILQDVLAADCKIPIEIRNQGLPRRRTAGVKHFKDRYYDIDRLADLALYQQEMDVVLQAAGRVRPYTRPREIITFQCAEHPNGAYTRDFASLAEARKFFGIGTDRQRKKSDLVSRIRAGKAAGKTQVKISNELCVSLRTVKRYWRS